ncbi:hypothetical protein [Halomicrococcus sp. SG-WS-1]|uniref:hypothetical protein n=1 Tax=Halomicrococcus sp. SG-WS-1 TaxID=3439057 RepID=UPI003F7B2413
MVNPWQQDELYLVPAANTEAMEHLNRFTVFPAEEVPNENFPFDDSAFCPERPVWGIRKSIAEKYGFDNRFDQETVREIDAVLSENASEIVQCLEVRMEDATYVGNSFSLSDAISAIRQEVPSQLPMGIHEDVLQDSLLLFYTGGEYTVAAQLTGVKYSPLESFLLIALKNVTNPALVESRARKLEDQLRFREVEYPYLLLLSDVDDRVNINSRDLAEVLGHDRDNIISFTRFTDPERSVTLNEFGSFWDFINRSSSDIADFGRWLSEEEPWDSGLSQPPTDSDKYDRSIFGRPEGPDVPDVAPFGEYGRLASVLCDSRLAVVCGPPASGKEAGLRVFADEWFDSVLTPLAGESDRIRRSSFYSNITPAEFIEGRSSGGKADGGLPTGPFGQHCNVAAADAVQARSKGQTPPKHIHIIKDFTAVEPATAFGPVWELLPESGRGSNTRVRLPQTGFPFYIPENMYVIGIVDSSETLLGDLPANVRQRFSVFKVSPQPDRVKNIYENPPEDHEVSGQAQDILSKSLDALEAVNDALRETHRDRYRLGYTVFTRLSPGMRPLSSEAIANQWQNYILPYLNGTLDGELDDLLYRLGESFAVDDAEVRSLINNAIADEDALENLLEGFSTS